MILVQWLLKRFATNLLILIISLTALLSLFDVLARANVVTADADGFALPLYYYARLRLPAILTFIAPFAVLIASLQTFSRLAAQQEIVALQSSGFNLYRLTAIIATAVTCLAIAQFFFTDRVVTSSLARLVEWQSNDYHGLPKPGASPEKIRWIANQHYVAHLSGVNRNGTVLKKPTLIWRDQNGRMTRYITAKNARYRDGAWALHAVTERDMATSEVTKLKSLPVDFELLPVDFASLNQQVELLTFSELMMLGSGEVETQNYSTDFYHVAAFLRIAQPLSAVVMVLLAAPVTLQLGRHGHRVIFSVFAMTMGFLYFVVERILSTLGETGELAALAAVWGPHAIFGIIGLTVMVHQQR